MSHRCFLMNVVTGLDFSETGKKQKLVEEPHIVPWKGNIKINDFVWSLFNPAQI